MRSVGKTHLVTTSRGTLRTHHLVNAAGLHADTVDRLLGHEAFTVTPRRGQLIVYDKFARDLVRHILLPEARAWTSPNPAIRSRSVCRTSARPSRAPTSAPTS
ncbi:hypothetical protein [Streptomyces sp. Je 1-369]|uniref:hypothetical protein n=1 Tax=Streptomyces sp. Je 1-369 TaxID=2966192 RepID=UPI0039E18EE2